MPDFTMQKDFMTKEQLERFGEVTVAPFGAFLVTESESFFIILSGLNLKNEQVYDTMFKQVVAF